MNIQANRPFFSLMHQIRARAILSVFEIVLKAHSSTASVLRELSVFVLRPLLSLSKLRHSGILQESHSALFERLAPQY